MKHHWRRLCFTLTAVIAVVIVAVVGIVLWLQQSGRLAQFAQDKIQQISGQAITLDAITFSSWNTIAVTDIRLRPPIPGWQLEIICPRLEAHFSVTSLFNKTISTLVVVQPTLQLARLDTASTAPGPANASGPIGLPVSRIQIQQGTLQVRYRDASYTLEQIEASIRPDNAAMAQIEAQAVFGPNAATLQGRGRIGLDFSQPSGNWQVKLYSDALPQLNQALAGLIPPKWSITQGKLETMAEIELRDQTIQGMIRTKMTHGHGTIAEVAIGAMTLSTEMAIDARITSPRLNLAHLNLKGTAQIQAERVNAPGELIAQQLVLDTPINFTVTPEAWQFDIELTARSQAFSPGQAVRFTQLSSTMPLTAQSTTQGWSGRGHIKVRSPSVVIGDIAQPTRSLRLTRLQSESPVRFTSTSEGWTATANVSLKSRRFQVGQRVGASQFSSTFPLQVQLDSQGWHLQGTADLTAQTVHYETPTTKTSAAKPATQMVLDAVQVRLPIRATATAIELENTHIQAQDWRWFTADAVHLQTPVEIRATSQIDVNRQRFNLKRVDLTLPELGTSWGSGKWAWKQQAVRGLQIELRPATAKVLWSRLSTWFPAPFPAWQVDGQTSLTLQTKRFSWHPSAPPPWWNVTWHLDQIAFNSPEADIAAEHVSGILQARVKLPTPSSSGSGSGPYEFDGRLHLKPFALLIGSFFPALEDHHVATNLTVTGTYHPHPPRLTLKVEGQVGKLGRLMGQGTLHRASTSWHYAATCALQNLNASQIWQTLISTPTSDPTAASATPSDVSGELNANLTLHGQDTSAHLQGQLDLTAFHFQSGNWSLEDATLNLPVDLRYPLPQTEPDTATLPNTAYGRLKIARAQLGSVSLPTIDTPLALRSDSLLFAHTITLPLLDGHLILQQLEAVRLLQPQRRIQMRLFMQNLNLQHLQRHSTKLPIAGRANAEFPRVQIDGTRLVTAGSLSLDVAGGRVRITNLHGRDLFSSIPSLGAAIRTDAPLSLLQLTQIYPIGDIGGTLHFSLDNLIVTAGEPAAFHLVFKVQEKRSEKRDITLRALNNLLFTTGSAKVDAGQAYRLPYKRFGADITLRHDILRLRGLYHDKKGREYFMRAPLLGGGVSIINRVPKHGVPFRSFIQRLKAAVLEQPAVSIK